LCVCGRKTDDKLAALPESGASCFDRATVHRNKGAHQAEADSQALLRTLKRVLDTREHFENLMDPVTWNSDARITHRYDHGITLALRGQRDNAAIVRVFGRVVEQVGKHLSQAD